VFYVVIYEPYHDNSEILGVYAEIAPALKAAEDDCRSRKEIGALGDHDVDVHEFEADGSLSKRVWKFTRRPEDCDWYERAGYVRLPWTDGDGLLLAKYPDGWTKP
jgi:hypothetical protein